MTDRSKVWVLTSVLFAIFALAGGGFRVPAGQVIRVTDVALFSLFLLAAFSTTPTCLDRRLMVAGASVVVAIGVTFDGLSPADLAVTVRIALLPGAIVGARVLYGRWGPERAYLIAAGAVLLTSAVAVWQYRIGGPGGVEGFDRLNAFRNETLWLFPVDGYQARSAGGSFLAPSTFGHSNEFGGVIVIALMVLDLCRREALVSSRTHVPIAAAGVLALVLSGSRSAQLAFLMYLIVSFAPVARRLFLVVALAVAAAFFLVQVAVPAGDLEGLTGRLLSAATISSDDTVDGRIASAVDSFRLVASEPFGVGVVRYAEIAGTSHNSFLQLIALHGWFLGVLSLVLVGFAGSAGTRRAPGASNAGIGALAASLLLLATEDRAGSPGLLLALAMVVAVVVDRPQTTVQTSIACDMRMSEPG